MQTYNTKETVECEKRVADAWKSQCEGVLFNGAVSVSIDIYYTVPKSIAANSKKKEKAMIDGKWKTTKPDIDNVIKSVLDGLNGAVLKSRKMFAKNERTTVTVESLTKDEE
jgi:Holliday junction resolvase RusA-like endonuclease